MGRRQDKAKAKRAELMRKVASLHTAEDYLIEWWGECQSCAFWDTPDLRSLEGHPCTNPRSSLHGQNVRTSGYCPQWDAKWPEAAFAVMELENYPRIPVEELEKLPPLTPLTTTLPIEAAHGERVRVLGVRAGEDVAFVYEHEGSCKDSSCCRAGKWVPA